MSGLAIQTASRAMAYRAAMNAMRGGVRKPRYKLPSWLTYANVAGAWKASRSARARLGTYRRQLNKTLFGSRKRKQGQARIAAKRLKSGPVPKTPSSRVSARYAVAPSMTRFKKPTKKASLKQPKSAIVHYKEYGAFNANQVMYLNHEHIGSVKKLWMGIGMGLTKAILARAKVFPGKSIDHAMIGPRTKWDNVAQQLDDKPSATTLRLIYRYGDSADVFHHAASGNLFEDIPIEDIGASPDVYRTFSQIATDVAASLMKKYYTTAIDGQSLNGGAWLSAAQVYITASNAQPVYIQNLDDAEVHLYVNSLIKLQNVTIADHGYTETGVHGGGVNGYQGSTLNVPSAYDKNAIDANPIIGRLYSAKGLAPDLDTELADSTSLGEYFQQRQDSGFTLCGFDNRVTPSDLQKVAHLPTAKELYGPQSVTTGHVSIAPGSMKFHKTTFTLKKTFKELSKFFIPYDKNAPGYEGPVHIRHAFRHTLIGLKCAHKHGADLLSIGYNRDTDVGCYVTINRKVFPLKGSYADDLHTDSCDIVPTETYAGPPTMAN